MNNKRQIIEHIFGGRNMRLLGCANCEQKYVEFIMQNGERNKFTLEEVQPLLKNIMKNKLIKTNKGIQELLKNPS